MRLTRLEFTVRMMRPDGVMFLSAQGKIRWKKHKLESRLLREISITSYMHITPPLWQKARGTKEPLDESERGE